MPFPMQFRSGSNSPNTFFICLALHGDSWYRLHDFMHRKVNRLNESVEYQNFKRTSGRYTWCLLPLPIQMSELLHGSRFNLDPWTDDMFGSWFCQYKWKSRQNCTCIFIQLWIIIGNTQNRSRKRHGGKRKHESLKCCRKSETRGDIEGRNRKFMREFIVEHTGCSTLSRRKGFYRDFPSFSKSYSNIFVLDYQKKLGFLITKP